MVTDVNLEQLQKDMDKQRHARPPVPIGNGGQTTRSGFYSTVTPEAPDVGPMAAKHRELMEALGALPYRTLLAFNDAARRTSSPGEWSRVQTALYALIGDPE